MSRRRYSLALVVFAIALSIPVSLRAQSALAEVQVPARYARAIQFARTLVTAVLEESGTPGMSVAVGIDGRILWSEGFGYADVENRVPVWEQTKFRIGSVSKPITAAAVGLLVEQNKLDLDAPIQRYVPTFPEKRWPITTRQLSGHLAGIRHYANAAEFLSAKRYASVLDGLEIFSADTLLFEPGERYSYSSYGWNLISAAVEGASGEPFLSYLQENVFEPLGMTHTVADHTDSIIPHRTRFYDRAEDGNVLNAPHVDNSYKWAGGGFISTPEDLVRFGFAHLRDDFLQPATVVQLWTPQVTNDGESTGYGIGWDVATENGKVSRAAHGGGSVGGTTSFILHPQEGAAIAIVGNLSQAPTAGALPVLIMEAFLDPDALTSAADTSGPNISGSYDCIATTDGSDVAQGTLVLQRAPGEYWGRTEWTIQQSDSVSRERVIASFTYEDRVRVITLDDDGRLTSLWLIPEGSQLRGRWVSGSSGELTCERQVDG